MQGGKRKDFRIYFAGAEKPLEWSAKLYPGDEMSKGKIAGYALLGWFVLVGARELIWPTPIEIPPTTAADFAQPVVAPIEDEPEEKGRSKESLRDASEIKFQLASEDLPGVVDSKVGEDGKLIVEVSQAWHYEPKPTRLQAAQQIGKAWYRIDEVGSGRFSLVDVSGNEVGGLGLTGVWVSD